MRIAALSSTFVVLTLCACGPSGSGDGGSGDSSSGGSGSTGTTDSTTASTSASTTASTSASTSASTTATSSTTDASATTTDATTTDGADSSTTDPSGGSSSDTGSSGFSVSGQVTRSGLAVISLGDDGIGTLYVGALTECSQDAASAGGTSVEMADLSMVDTPVDFTISGLPNGTYYIAGFLDDDENADPDMPDADMGDLAFAMGFMAGCVEVTIDNADVTGADFALNINVPF